MMRKLVIIFAALCLAIAGLSGVAMAKKVLKFAHVAPPFHGQSKGVDAFAAYVKKMTKGQIVIRTFPGGQLGSERSMAEQVQAGTLHMASITTAVLSNYAPQVAVVDLPFIFPSRQVAYQVLDDPAFQKRLFGYLRPKGFVGIGYTENEWRDLNNRKKPIRTPADIKGMKIRVMNSPVYMDTFRQLGASPVGIPFPELYSALQQGVIDAQENPLYTSILIKATEVAKYVTKTGHILTECIIIVNPAVWDSLTVGQQKIFRQAAKIAIKTNRAVTEAHFKKLPKYKMSIAAYCKKNNVQVVKLSSAERAQWAKAMQPVWSKYRKIVGPKFFDFFVATIKKYSK